MFCFCSCCSGSLTSSQPHTRARGVQLLSDVLQENYADLTEREVEVLIAFYENRLKDHHVVTPPVLRGLQALTKCTALPPGSAVSMLRSVFQDVHVQVRLTHCCTTVSAFIGFFLLDVPSELKGLGADFVFGFVQSMDGERDPRNLLLAFQIANNIILGGYSLGKFTEELFEVTSCYFPIDFTPPPNDPHGITKEELILALRTVLTGTPSFAEFLLPLIIEKMDSDIQSAKLDSLQTLAACGSKYDHRDLAEFLQGLWTSLRREVCSVLQSLSRFSLTLAFQWMHNHFSHEHLSYWECFRCKQQQKSSTQMVHESVLSAYRAALCSMVFSALSESNSSLQITATTVLTSLIQHKGLLLDSDVGLAVDHLTRLLLTEEDESVSSAVVECAGALAELHPAALITKLIPKLKEEIENSEMNSHHAMRQRCLSALAAVSLQPSVVFESTPVLLQVLNGARFSVDEVVLACRSLQRIAEQVQDTEETGRCFHDNIIPRLLSLALQAAPMWFPVGWFHVSRLAGQTAARAVSLFLDGDVSFLPDNSFPSHIQSSRKSHGVGLSWFVCSWHVCVEVPQMERLLFQLEELSCSCSHLLSYTSAAKCFAGLINKRPLGNSLDDLIQTTMKRVCSELGCTSSPVRIQAFTLMTWVAKALLLRYHPLFSLLTDKLFSLLDDPDLGPMAADSFSLLMSDSADVLNRGCHADVRIMYRQRFFSENSAKLVQGFNAAPQEKKSNYLKALSNIVNELPKQVQVSELPALLSLILEALTCPDQSVQLSTLSCLEPVLMNPPQVLIQQLEALVSRLLALLCSPAMKIRIASVRCIHALSQFPTQVLPFRARVLRALAQALDDKKRLVRREAVHARGAWFLLGSPGGR
uniref:MMS19 nucleotide excision repair protein n=1 Tax=Nothobranchius furzeri TaxID=105023 RepID=A0A8C6P3L3_NOTFU